MRFRALIRRAVLLGQVENGMYQGHVSNCLRKISELALARWVVFLREQPNVIAKRQKLFQKSLRLRMPVLQNIIVGEPEAAGKKDAFAGLQAVASLFRAVAKHKLVLPQTSLNRTDRAQHPLVIGRQEADQWYPQQTRIQRLGAIRLHKAPHFPVEAIAANIFEDLLPH